MSRRTARLTLTSLAVACVMSVAAPAQQAAAPAEQTRDATFFDTVDVQVVNVEVVVTGPDGAPVRGLSREDFELLEDGRPVAITNFYSVADTPLEALDPLAAVAARQRTEPADQQLHLGIFIDGLTLEQSSRRMALDAVRDFFSYQLARPTSLVLASFDGNLKVDSLEGFDIDRLNENMKLLEEAATRGSLRELERRALLAELDRVDLNPTALAGVINEEIGTDEARRLLTAIRIYAQQQYDQARMSTDALGSMVEAMAGLPGRKALLYISGGLARNPGEALYHAWDNKFSEFIPALGVNVMQLARELDTTPDVGALVRHANANRVTFYVLGAGRGGVAGGVSAEQVASPGGGPSWSVVEEAMDNSNLAAPLARLAAETGGLSLINSRNFDRLLTGMNRDFGAYYSLGYMPDRKLDGNSHKLRVRVKSPALSVRHRETYRDQTRDEVMNGRTRSAVLLGGGENPLEVAMEFGNRAADDKDRFLVPIMVKVPLSKLVLVPQEGAHVGRIGIFVCARDDRGRTSPVQSFEVPIRIPDDKLEAALGQVAGYRMVLQMRGVEHAVAIGVRDELGRVESTVTGVWDPTVPAG